jgi:hypothetical protein
MNILFITQLKSRVCLPLFIHLRGLVLIQLDAVHLGSHIYKRGL